MLTFATNEDIAIRASADLPLICPREQTIASGSDGAFRPGDVWTLRSSTVDFSTQGVLSGQVIQLTRPTQLGARSPSQLFMIDSVGPFSVTLRRQGEGPLKGDPPAPTSGLTGVQFRVMTLAPQIVLAGQTLDQRFGLGNRLADGPGVDPNSARILTDAVVLLVLSRQYLAVSQSGAGQPDLFATKAAYYQAEFNDLIARFIVRGDNETSRWSVPPAFGTRLSR